MIKLVVSFLVVLLTTTSLSAQCPPGYSQHEINFTVSGTNCVLKIYTCAKYDPTTGVLSILMGDVEQSGECGCLTRANIISYYSGMIVSSLLPSFPAAVPPCPSKGLVVKISPSACATECINTGCYKVFSNGSYGTIYKSWSCTTDYGCRWVYEVCCNTTYGPCPPNAPTLTLLGTEMIGPALSCGTKSVPVCDNPLGENIIIECKPQCP